MLDTPMPDASSSTSPAGLTPAAPPASTPAAVPDKCANGCGKKASTLACPKCRECVPSHTLSSSAGDEGEPGELGAMRMERSSRSTSTTSEERRVLTVPSCARRLGVPGQFFCSQLCFAKNCASASFASRLAAPFETSRR